MVCAIFRSSVKIYELDNNDSDNDDETASSNAPAPPNAHKPSLWNFPWWRVGENEQSNEQSTENYLIKTLMKNRDGEALLVDPGSLDNLAGDEWSERMDTTAQRAGRPKTVTYPMRNPLQVGGIGQVTQTATHKVVHRIGLANGREANYETPVLPRSGTRALLGQRSLKKLRALIDCFTGRLYFIGPGGYEIRLSPGSETHELEESHAGHLMLPCSEFKSNQQSRTEPMQAMNAQSTKTDGAASASSPAGATPRPRM